MGRRRKIVPHERRQSRSPLSATVNDAGFALPSVLLLLTILTLAAMSILSLQYLRRQLVIRETHLIRADFAAKSGIARAFADFPSGDSSLAHGLSQTREYTFDDGGRALTELTPWGFFQVIRSQGVSGRLQRDVIALAANRITLAYAPALTLGNTQHHLVMTGTAHIRGDVSVGPSGVTTSTLPDHATPLHVPVAGNIRTQGNASMVRARSPYLDHLAASYRELLSGNIPEFLGAGTTATILPDQAGHCRISSANDSLRILKIPGDLDFEGEIVRSWPPLLVLIQGSATVRKGARLQGLVLLAARDSVTLKQGAYVSDVILLGGRSLRVEAGASATCQCIAPVVTVDSGAVLSYPSAVVAFDLGSAHSPTLHALISGGALIEGFAGLLSCSRGVNPESLLELSSGARVVGVLYSSSRLTLDGEVIGSVACGDLYLYQAPTTYFGWMRSGSVDRVRLPKGMLLPYVVADRSEMDLLKWILL